MILRQKNRKKSNDVGGAVPYNYGIDILRMWMCFEVVLSHFWEYEPAGNPVVRLPLAILSYFRAEAVPCFMFVSFLLCAGSLNRPAESKQALGKRVRRLATPILFWSICYFIGLNLSGLLTGTGVQFSVADLILQLLVGHVYNSPMWFLNVLLALTLTVILTVRLVPHRHLLRVNIIITALAILFSISGLNYSCFENLDSEFRYPIGRYFEMLPFAGIANIIYLSGFRISQAHNQGRRMCILALCCAAGWMVRYIYWPVTFGYGTPFHYAFTVPFVLLIWTLPFGRIAGIIRKTISPVAHYTLGIYCLQSGIGNTLNYVCRNIGWPQDTLTGCLIIFVISLVICRLLDFIPCRWVRQSLS